MKRSRKPQEIALERLAFNRGSRWRTVTVPSSRGKEVFVLTSHPWIFGQRSLSHSGSISRPEYCWYHAYCRSSHWKGLEQPCHESSTPHWRDSTSLLGAKATLRRSTCCEATMIFPSVPPDHVRRVFVRREASNTNTATAQRMSLTLATSTTRRSARGRDEHK